LEGRDARRRRKRLSHNLKVTMMKILERNAFWEKIHQ